MQELSLSERVEHIKNQFNSEMAALVMPVTSGAEKLLEQIEQQARDFELLEHIVRQWLCFLDRARKGNVSVHMAVELDTLPGCKFWTPEKMSAFVQMVNAEYNEYLPQLRVGMNIHAEPAIILTRLEPSVPPSS